MRVRRRWHPHGKGQTIEDAVSISLDGSSYDRGQLEAVVATQGDIVGFLGRLLTVLNESGKLTNKETLFVLGAEWEEQE